jgi:hypothetical protein
MIEFRKFSEKKLLKIVCLFWGLSGGLARLEPTLSTAAPPQLLTLNF